MSTGTLQRRHALGLPAGSIRAAHVLGVVGLVCAMLLIPQRYNVHVPPYLIYLLFLILGHYFGAHGNTIATREDEQHSPLYLPGGSVRFLIVVALGGTIGWKLYSDPDDLRAHFDASLADLQAQPYMPLVILGGFFVGVLIRALVGRKNPPQAWQDFEAWISLLALVGLLAAAIIHLVIGTSVQEKLSLPVGEGVLGAVIAFYFGARS
jgi:hypothetical protein